MPKKEPTITIELPQPQEPEDDSADWAESQLFQFVQAEHRKILIKKGIIKVCEGEERPFTPQQHRGLNPQARSLLNLK